MKLKTFLFATTAAIAVLLSACNPEETITGISVDPAAATLTEVGDTVTLTAILAPVGIKTNVIWASSNTAVATVSGDGLTAVVTAVGDGTAKITATADIFSSESTITVSIGVQAVPTIYSENFGNAVGSTAPSEGWPFVAQYTGYERGGLGGAVAVYTQEGGSVSIRGNNASDNNGYEGASGACNAMMAATGASFVIKDIATCGAKNFTLSFGGGQTSAICKVYYRIYNTTEWIELPYEKIDEYWGKVQGLNFTVPTGTNTISLKYTAAVTQYGTRVDDILLTTEDATSTPIIDVETPVVVECEVVDLPLTTGNFNNAIPTCWIYITNNPSYPDPTYYSNGGLKINYENMGITSREFNMQSNIKVIINIGALNANTKTTAASTDVFTVKGYNATGGVVGTAALTSVAVGENTVNLAGTGIVKVDVVMTGYPKIGSTYQNVNLASVKIETN